MKFTILFDLDDTLIHNDMDRFLKVYLQKLAEHVPQVPANLFIKELLTATGKMVANTNPARTLEETFDQAFYPSINHPKETLIASINLFYDEVFPGFRYLTQPEPRAVALVEKFIQQGNKIIIATNPLFPRKAVLHRLEWAGLSHFLDQFEIITSFEKFHFSKPNPAYVTEILAQLGWPDRPAVMIGNSLEDDCKPAVAAGVPAFWLQHDGTLPSSSNLPGITSGHYEDIPIWLEKVADQSSLNHKSPTAIAPTLRSTLAVLPGLIKNYPAPEDGNGWSSVEIICHLRDVENEIYQPRIRQILNEFNPYFEDMDPSNWPVERNYRQQDAEQVLAEFIEVRKQTLKLIEPLKADDWQRTANHQTAGQINLQMILSAIAEHDRDHIRSLFRQVIS